MADEPQINQDAGGSQDSNQSRAQERITDLSEKVKNEATLRVSAETKAAEAAKRAEFAEGFADMVSVNPAAKDFKADIQAKVMAGLSVEDATFAVLGKAGKLGAAPIVQRATDVAGGSATNTITQGTSKSPSEMSQAERREELAKALIIQ